jgi:hypothetical protein
MAMPSLALPPATMPCRRHRRKPVLRHPWHTAGQGAKRVNLPAAFC